MNVSLIGSGNVAAVLGRLIKDAGHLVDAVISRNTETGAALAAELNAVYIQNAPGAYVNSDLYIIAVSDSAIETVARELKAGEALIVHTSGAVSKNVLKNHTEHYGVLYPLQSLRKELKTIPVIPFLVDANSEKNVMTVTNFAGSLSGIVRQAGDEARLKMHLSAVIVSNFTNHLYALADRYCQAENLDFNLLHPIIKEVADRLAFDAAENLQTGPAVRGDIQTIETHLGLLEKYPALKSLYKSMTESIGRLHK